MTPNVHTAFEGLRNGERRQNQDNEEPSRMANKCYSSMPIIKTSDINLKYHNKNNNPVRIARTSASIIGMSSANCDNYNLMCQLYKSINSREKFPIIKQSPGGGGGDWWNNFSRRRRKRPPQLNNTNWRFILQTAIVLLFAICPRGVWSWSVQSDPSFYHQPAEDYYSGN